MGGPPPPVADVRVAVRRALADLDGLVLVACSGGPDSLALAAATAFEAPRLGLRAGLLTVDHGLQPGSAAQAARVRDWAKAAGLDPAEVLTVTVGGSGGPEAAARDARYAALDIAAGRLGAAAVLLGHTRDDQAETVLLAMARGAGARALAGMPPRRGRYRRPLLGVSRAVTAAACAADALPVWSDPHNADPAYARVRVRALLPALEEAAGPGAVAGLARTAARVRADAELLDSLATAVAARVVSAGEVDAVALGAEPAPLRTRVLHAWVLSAGTPAGALSAVHVDALDALVSAWAGQGPVHLPGGILVTRREGRLAVLSGGRATL
ncbi:MAG TPA: tRNA lysidine(34) synthetase TilS [Mycobacteriales bacterium]|jgi:tRNA(Ile)-lysidine synthase